MKFLNIKNPKGRVSFLQAVEQGVGSDGGLFVPENFPQFSPQDFIDDSFPAIAKKVLLPFVREDFDEFTLSAMIDRAFNFEIPLVPFLKNPATSVPAAASLLQLYHGPTGAFKDIGARFIAEVLSAKSDKDNDKDKMILVATSGDTGGAVASAFFQKPHCRVVILFPLDGVSNLQKQQLTCWGQNIMSLGVKGSFDQCQAIVKTLLAENELVKQWRLTSANSINIARLLPQACYYAASSIWWWKSQITSNTKFQSASPFVDERPKVDYIIPTGNMGNALGCIWARRMGFPINKITLATNANRVIPDYFITGQFNPQLSIPTLANAMDVGNPSNFARLQYHYPELASLESFCSSIAVSDEEIRSTIQRVARDFGFVICPHTATAVAVALNKLHPFNGIIVSTAHPGKFREVVEPLVSAEVPLPESLRQIFNVSPQFQVVSPKVESIKEIISQQLFSVTGQSQ